MSELWISLILCGLTLIIAAAMVLLYRRRTRRIMDTLNSMLDAAIRGDFAEKRFDESIMSSVETRMYHYLAASQVSVRNLAEEKERIKELIGDISHQTKTPLANILLYAQLLGEQALPQSARDCVEPLNTQAEKLKFLIDALVKTSRLETGILSLHKEPASLDELLCAVTQQVRPLAEQKQISLCYSGTDAFAVFDPKWTSEAVYNLLDNAVKYTPERGSITVEVLCYQMFCKITVTDTGIGIPEEEQARIFTRFYRSPAVAHQAGVGIGLYLSRQIVDAQGGCLSVSSKPGEGSTFSILLPTCG